jgi:hypothetical protein
MSPSLCVESRLTLAARDIPTLVTTHASTTRHGEKTVSAVLALLLCATGIRPHLLALLGGLATPDAKDLFHVFL